MSIIILGTTAFSIKAAEGFITNGRHISAMISMPEDIRPNNSVDIKGFAAKHHIPYVEITDINSKESLKVLKGFKPDYLFIAWPRMLKHEVINLPKYCCIGTHPTDLPYNRGRHPLHWLISQGISFTKLSFFCLDEGVDTGDLLLQHRMEINDQDTIADLDDKVNEAVKQSIKDLEVVLKKFENAFLKDNCIQISNFCKRQDHGLANSWRKKTPFDVTLDLRLPCQYLIRIVRSFSSPYPCAKLLFENSIIDIIEATNANVELAVPEEYIEPGKIIETSKNTIVVKAGDGLICLVCAEDIPDSLKKKKYVHPPLKYLTAINRMHEMYI
jgi:methionyl-tRNA formyltransferase